MDINNPDRYTEIRSILQKKRALNFFYQEVYQKYKETISQCPTKGIILEIGSGGGFAKEVIPEIITSDVIPYPNLDNTMDAMALKFPDKSLSCICLFNVLHHIPNVRAFFKEAIRCLIPNGRIFMVEPYAGWISSWIFRYLHHEDFDTKVTDWTFHSKGPLSDANNALPYIIFERDRKIFSNEFPELVINSFIPHTPFRYWLTGGLRKWSLLPAWAYHLSCWLDKKFINISPRFGSFVDIELIKA